MDKLLEMSATMKLKSNQAVNFIREHQENERNELMQERKREERKRQRDWQIKKIEWRAICQLRDGVTERTKQTHTLTGHLKH